MRWTRRVQIRALSVAAIWAIAASCDGPLRPITFDGTLTVDKAQYTITGWSSLRPALALNFTFVNRSSATLYVQRDCGGGVDSELGRLSGNNTEIGFNGHACPVSQGTEPGPIAVASGAMFAASLLIQPAGFPVREPISAFTGQMQLILRISGSSNGSNVAPIVIRSSPGFEVVAP